jgi:hypothetical protein
MLGPAKPRRLDEPIAVSLEDLVPRDHFYRHLEATLDLSFVREWARASYADRGRPSNIVALEEAGIRAFFPLPDFDRRTPFFGKHDFTYDAAADVYRCPGDQPLRFRTHKHAERIRIYKATAAACNACRLKSQCTTSNHGRQVRRSLDETYVERVRGYHATEPYQKALRKRQVWVEPLFAEAKLWHGLRRLRLRGLMNANIQGLLIAAGQNLKRFLAATGWGRRNAPCGSLVAHPRQLQRVSAISG